jgi:hypothetical protein
MRRYGFRSAVLVVSAVLAFGVFGAPREAGRDSRERSAVKVVRRVVRALGDLLTVPVPAPTPAPNP